MKCLCVYCGEFQGTTRDHIPPKCFFEKPCPSIKRITVPCCERCRVGSASGDAVARNLIISTAEAEPHRVIESQLAPARNRAFKRHGQLPAVVKHMVPADAYSPGGIYLRSAPAFNLNTPVIDAFIHRIVRGLLHEEKKSGFAPCSIEWRPNPAKNDCDLFVQGKFRTVGDVFSYSVLFRSSSLDSLWLLTFYERLRFLVHLGPTAT